MVTLLTYIEGSTRLLTKGGERCFEALADHRRKLRERLLLLDSDGYVLSQHPGRPREEIAAA
jgi:hypothetical protein